MWRDFAVAFSVDCTYAAMSNAISELPIFRSMCWIISILDLYNFHELYFQTFLYPICRPHTIMKITSLWHYLCLIELMDPYAKQFGNIPQC